VSPTPRARARARAPGARGGGTAARGETGASSCASAATPGPLWAGARLGAAPLGGAHPAPSWCSSGSTRGRPVSPRALRRRDPALPLDDRRFRSVLVGVEARAAPPADDPWPAGGALDDLSGRTSPPVAGPAPRPPTWWRAARGRASVLTTHDVDEWLTTIGPGAPSASRPRRPCTSTRGPAWYSARSDAPGAGTSPARRRPPRRRRPRRPVIEACQRFRITRRAASPRERPVTRSSGVRVHRLSRSA
jgi:hypothetical protein